MPSNFTSSLRHSPLVPWEEFHSLIRPVAQECPVSIIDAAIKAACIEFCQKSLIWTTEAICGDIIAGDRVYKYNNENDGISVVMPISCIIQESETGKQQHHSLTPTNRQDLDYYEPNWRLLEADIPTRYFMIDPNTICLVESPSKSYANGLHVLCAIKPNKKAKGVAEFIYEDWGEEIAHGALARIHSMVGRVWANPQLVSYYQSKFRAAISRAKSKFYKSHVAQSKRMLPVQYAA